MRRRAGLVLAAVLMAVALPVTGFAETWSVSKTLAGGEEITDAVVLDGAVTVEVASGTATISGAVSGGRLVKTGAGELKLSGANTMEGVTVSAGAVTAASNDALGAGTAIVLGQREGYEGRCELRFNSGSKDGSLTIPNAIEVSGNTTRSYPGFVFYYQKTVLNGAITAAQDLIFYEDYPSAATVESAQYNRSKNCLSATFGNTITAGGIVGSGGWVRYQFNGKVTAEELSTGINRPQFSTDKVGTTSYKVNGNQNAHLAFVVTVPCALKMVSSGFGSYIFTACADAFPGAILNGLNYQTVGSGDNGNPYYYFSNYGKGTGYAQSIAGLETAVRADTFTKPTLHCSAPKAMTLTITGLEPEPGQETREMSSSIVMEDALSIKLAAPTSFTQTFANKNHTTTGALTVESGTMKLTGTARFTAVTGLTVENGGVFDASSTTAEDFLPTNGTLALSLKTGAVLKVPEGCTEWKVKTLTFDGALVKAGTVATAANFPAIPQGLTITAVSGGAPAEPKSTAIWTGAGDKVMTNMANWEGAPESLDLANGTLGVTVAAGGDMIFPGTIRVNKISWPDLATGAQVVLCPQDPDSELVVDREIGKVTSLTKRPQVVVRGRISTPSHFDQGTAGRDAATTFSYEGMVYATGVTVPDGVIAVPGESSVNSLPLVLDNAIIEKPIYVRNSALGGYSLYALQNTTNILLGHVQMPSPIAYAGGPVGSVIEFRGGLTSGWANRFGGSGTIIIRDKPMIANDKYHRITGSCRVVFDAPGCYAMGNESDEGFCFQSGAAEFLRSGCFASDDLTFYVSNSGAFTAEFNTTTQRVGIASFSNTKSGSVLHGDYPAMLEIVGNYRSGALTKRTQSNNIQVTGGLGFRTCGTNANFRLTAKAYESTGDLVASAGTLELAEGATWLNGTNFVADGGTLKFASTGQVDKNKAKLAVSDGGTVCVADGSMLKFAAATVDGTPVPTGRYAAGDGTPLGSCLTSGAIQVGKPGLILLFR